MIFKLFAFKDLSIQSYLVGDSKTKDCVVIDPPRQIDLIEAFIKENHLNLKAILETHVHADFISGAYELKHAFENTPKIYASACGGKEWIPSYVDVRVEDHTKIPFASFYLEALHTPGHTPEHLTWLLYDQSEEKAKPIFAFTGDFLFVEGIGRPDLLGDSMTSKQLDDLHHSLFSTITHLPDNLQIFPSHGAGSLCAKSISSRPSSTLGEERKLNAAFQIKDPLLWKEKIQEEMPKAPATFLKNKKKNIKGAPLVKSLEAKLYTGPIPPNEMMIIDFRDPISFGEGHLKGSVNVPMAAGMGNWLASVISDDLPVLLLINDLAEKERVIALLRTLGFDLPIYYVVWDDLIEKPGLEPLEGFQPAQLKEKIKADSKDSLYIIDVRAPGEWARGHIDQAHHMELASLKENLSKIPQNKTIVAVCGSGVRSSVAASLIKREGFNPVYHLLGGMRAWDTEE